MLCAPTLRLLVLQVTFLLFTAPAGNATALQPLIATPPSANVTLPVGAVPATVAVNVTAAPTSDGLPEVVSDVLLAALFTVCVSVLLVEPALPPSPPYVATMLWAPTLRLLVLQIAVLLLAAPAGNATALQPLIALPPSVNATLPVGAEPETVAVKVTAAPTSDGVPEVVTDVLLDTLFTVCVSALLVEPVLPASPP